ncbi:large ribosomal subunit protein uL23m [Linepithema humile]|uniref:large ribosomal subunit protein uL23m n=1 Tax=Linepithema humile TaxID=83485 RepID=UPI0006237DC8|nr:PREDICTED: probable 39S ribosomal protein L23, mitochondrial isoform X1 [Linepithema humile]XP_012222735.1 PREDICTED: probable 39S ribosomal protein L23, mitochondrial isoform X2 [Linepithema humile]
MSTRWYPIYQRGNPQLRVFLPNFWMKLIQPVNKQPNNIVQFHCSMEMTRFDIKNYLKKIYNVNVLDVKTYIAIGKTTREKLQGSVIKEDDRKLAYVVLPEDQSFVFPSLFKEAQGEFDEKSMNEAKKDLQEFVESSKAPGLPGWFRI